MSGLHVESHEPRKVGVASMPQMACMTAAMTDGVTNIELRTIECIDVGAYTYRGIYNYT